MSKPDETKLKNRLWRRLTKRLNRRNILRLATLFRRLFARVFCMGNDGQQPTAGAECSDADREQSTPESVRDDDDDMSGNQRLGDPEPDADRTRKDLRESPVADQDDATVDADTDIETVDEAKEENDGANTSTESSGKEGHIGNRVAALRQLQRQMYMEDTFTAAKPPLPPLPPHRNWAPVQYTRPVHRVPEVITTAAPQDEVAPPTANEVVQMEKKMAGTEEVPERDVEDMTDDDIDDIINEILAC